MNLQNSLITLVLVGGWLAVWVFILRVLVQNRRQQQGHAARQRSIQEHVLAQCAKGDRVAVRAAWELVLHTKNGAAVVVVRDAGQPADVLSRQMLTLLKRVERDHHDGPPSSRGESLRQQLAAAGGADRDRAPAVGELHRRAQAS
jgi:hypothetical protein